MWVMKLCTFLMYCNLIYRLALLGNFAVEEVEVYRVLLQAGGQAHSAPSKLPWPKVDEANILIPTGRIESNKSEALAKHCNPSQSHVVMLFWKINALLRLYSQLIWRKNDLRRNFAVKYPNGDNNKANIRIFLTTVWLDIPISSFLPSNTWTLLLRSWARYARRQTSNYERLQRNSGYDLRHPFDLPLWVQRFPD